MKTISSQRSGSLMIDTLLGVGVAALMAVALGGLAGVTNRSVTAARHQTEAVALAKASMEEVVALKHTNWSTLMYGPVVVDRVGLNFVLRAVPGADDIGQGYSRTIMLAPAYRDGSGQLASVGTIDPNVMRLTVTVGWTERSQNRHVTLEQYLTNWRRS